MDRSILMPVSFSFDKINLYERGKEGWWRVIRRSSEKKAPSTKPSQDRRSLGKSSAPMVCLMMAVLAEVEAI